MNRAEGFHGDARRIFRMHTSFKECFSLEKNENNYLFIYGD